MEWVHNNSVHVQYAKKTRDTIQSDLCLAQNICYAALPLGLVNYAHVTLQLCSIMPIEIVTTRNVQEHAYVISPFI